MSEYRGGAQGDGTRPTPPKPGSNDLTITTGGKVWGGWQGISVTTAIERFPSTFSVLSSEWDPYSATTISIEPGAECVVKIGDDRVLTGYAERYSPVIGARQHQVTIGGRGKACDFFDCMVDLQGNQISNTTLLGLVQQLAKPYGIAVRSLDGPGPVLSALNFFITQTPYEIAMQAARYCGFLLYDGPDGAIVLAQAQSGRKMASGFVMGVNIESCVLDFNMTERYSEYRCFIQSTDFLLDGTQPINEDPNRIVTVKDTSGIRHRVFSFVAEAGQNYLALAQMQANWELNRRRGRSQQVRLTTDQWRDKKQQIWQPNMLAEVTIPQVKLTNAMWLISEVTFRRDESGTHADLVLMPPESFQPQPTNLYLFDPNVQKALNGDPTDNKGGADSGKPRKAPPPSWNTPTYGAS